MHGRNSAKNSAERLARRRGSFKLQCIATATFLVIVVVVVVVSIIIIIDLLFPVRQRCWRTRYITFSVFSLVCRGGRSDVDKSSMLASLPHGESSGLQQRMRAETVYID